MAMVSLWLLWALQIADSMFPNGNFNHSYGLENSVTDGKVFSRDTLAEFMEVYLRHVLLRSDLLVCSLAHGYTAAEELKRVAELDRVLTAMKPARESREASILVGKMMMRTACPLLESSFLDRYSVCISNGIAPGNHAAVFGIINQAAGMDQFTGNMVFLYNACAGMISAGMKLIPLGQSDGQALQKRLQPLIIEMAQVATGMGIEELGVFVPALEIRTMAHERLYSRLFMS